MLYMLFFFGVSCCFLLANIFKYDTWTFSSLFISCCVCLSSSPAPSSLIVLLHHFHLFICSFFQAYFFPLRSNPIFHLCVLLDQTILHLCVFLCSSPSKFNSFLYNPKPFHCVCIFKLISFLCYLDPLCIFLCSFLFKPISSFSSIRCKVDPFFLCLSFFRLTSLISNLDLFHHLHFFLFSRTCPLLL